MSSRPVICFGQQPCGFFPKRFLVAKIQTARRLQQEIGGEIVFFYHDSDHDPRETQTLLRHRKTNEPAILNFAFANKTQRKFSPLYLKHIAAGWQEKTALQLPNYVGQPLIEIFKSASSGLPLSSPNEERAGVRSQLEHPSPQPSPRFDGARETHGSVADFCLDLYRRLGLLEGIRVVRSSDPAFRRAACEVPDFFVDAPYDNEIVRARFTDGSFRLHEGGDAFITFPATPFTKEHISPTRDTRLRWMQSVIHCTHYVAGAGEQAYLRREDAPEINFFVRDTIDRSDEAWTEI
ncbi:MAG: hypothetical protein U1F65_01490 [Verrucomicrobiota bacterium]